MEVLAKYQNIALLGGGVVTMSLGATIVSYANGVLSSTDAPKMSTTTMSHLTVVRNIGWVIVVLGLALISWYGYKVFAEYNLQSKISEFAKKYRPRSSSVESVASTTSA
jgi:heme/copper-type cytochrome/quinol oxidase subunit 2